MDLNTLNSAIDELGLAPFRAEIQGLARPCLDFVVRPVSEPVPPSRSKIGGLPDLPDGVEWPMTRDGTVPLLFLGRVCAADASRIDPEITHDLLFFAEWIYAGEGAIIPVQPGAATRQVAQPSRPEEAHPQLAECEVEVVLSLSLPGCLRTSPERQLYSPEILVHLEEPDEFWGDRVMHIPLSDLIHRSEIDVCGSESIVRYGGYPLHVQAHPETNANLNASTAGITDWRTLMVFGSDPVSGLSFGDTGFCGFLTTRRSLAEGPPYYTYFYQSSL